MAANPPIPRRRVGRQLRAMRERAGLSLTSAAERLDLSRSSLGRLELGETLATVHLARSMMDLYDDYQDQLLEAVRETQSTGWWQHYPVANRDYLSWEASATTVRELAVMRLPDLLRTEEYTLALLDRDRPVSRRRTSGRPPRPDSDSEVAVWRIRQRRLTDHHAPLTCVMVVDEAVLHKPVGGPEVMRAQLNHLVRCAAGQAVTVQVLPAAAGARTQCGGGFRVLEFDDPRDPPMMYADYPGATVREDKARQASRMFDAIQSMALPCEDSVRHIENVAEEVYGTA